ncbi:MerR family transcriptional regulator [Allokutzneria oryzae]|uniref:MerR family transcriptional regulator n=1 Tax=Allokutzneria oryzae TaxID=1378989 RepID=UPI00366C608F
MDRPIEQVAALTGASTRMLRHYDAIGLLRPSRTSAGGRRYYDEAALRRLWQILLLRELDVGLNAISDILDGRPDMAGGLSAHLESLLRERDRLTRRAEAVELLLERLEAVDSALDDLGRHRELINRFGPPPPNLPNWPPELGELQRRFAALAKGFAALRIAGIPPHDPRARTIAAAQHEALQRFWPVDAKLYVELAEFADDGYQREAVYAYVAAMSATTVRNSSSCSGLTK